MPSTAAAKTAPHSTSGAFTPLERRSSADLPYARFLIDYVAANRPVVITEATPAWPALRKWTPEYFKKEFGSKLVHITYDEQMKFSDFIDGVNASSAEAPGPYMYRLFICDHMPELLPDLLPGNPYAFPRRLASPLMPASWRRPDGYLKLLIGGVGGRFPVMHFDGENMHAAITEIHGDKEFIMYAPEDSPNVYPRADRENQSQIEDLGNPDLARFPLLAKARQYRTVLKPGETIFIPSRWWHTTRVLSPSVSVCVNMLDTSNWDGFVSEVCQTGRSPARLRAKRALLTAIGSTLSALEREPVAKLPLVGKRLGRLAPTESTMAPDLTEFRVRSYDGAPPY